MKKRWIAFGIVSLSLVSILVISFPYIRDVISEQAMIKVVHQNQAERWKKDMLYVVTVGTGVPHAEIGRTQSCTAIIAGGDLFLFDAGDGNAVAAVLQGLPLSSLKAIFVTHLHSDHVGGIGSVANTTFIFGRQNELKVYGPPGTTKVIDGFSHAFSADKRIRQIVGDADGSLSNALPVASEIQIKDDSQKMLLVYENAEGLKIYAFNVDHRPVVPAYGYRIEYRGRTVVISGDTTKSNNLTRHAQGSDILVCEAYSSHIMNKVFEVAKKLPEDPAMAIFRDHAAKITGYHMSTLQAATTAAESKTKHLVLTHIGGISAGLVRTLITEPLYLKGIGAIYKGPVDIAENGSIFPLSLK
ncbi:MAG: MBL fold metallo-hydrolase [Deltaproteobacteria bacterium]